MNKIQLPFAALRAFEQFARSGSVAAAAAALNISPSAVIHQLNALNEYTGHPLTHRTGRQLALTQEGRTYFETISPAFTIMRQATEQLNAGLLPRRILVSTLPLIGNIWLAHELPGFLRRHPQIDLQIQYARHRNYSSDSADISLRYGAGEWPGYDSVLLLRGDMAPVATPEFARAHGLLGDGVDTVHALLGVPLIHDGGPHIWERWFTAAGRPAGKPLAGLMCEDGLLALSATLARVGVSLARLHVIRRELRSGRLVQLSNVTIRDNHDYYLCSRNDQLHSGGIRTVVSYLRAAAAVHHDTVPAETASGGPQ